ncbi:nuclear pore complex protein GP210 [Phragmites australis]|uniref:nuclear pore complex protein GP210 n=1 Tax=Phragmites australis TaxID=29695 RepID=UPI002D7A01BE|nr:nuclear pore complex protein GP210 [Phragmites australis]
MGWPPAAAAVLAVVVALCASAPPVATSMAGGPHMADLSVLLPSRMTKPVEYRLIGGDGCFSWSWDHHDIISVKPEYNDSSRCSTSARLTSIAPYNGRRETSVYATDIISGITIHCKVFVDKISRIRIFHHAVKIDLDEVATLRVHAFDDEENVFSSLVGLQFLWQLSPMLLDNSSHHLVHIPLKETHLSDCSGFCGDMNIRIELEDKNLCSDFFVVKGIEIGQEVVTAQLFEPHFEHVIDTITLTVAEAMSLEPPSPVLMTIGVLVKFKLKVFRQKVAQVVNLPSQYHRWHATNSSVAQVDSSLGILHALSLGFTEVVVEDTRVSGHEQVSSVHVVIPRSLFLYLIPTMDDSAHLYGTTHIPSSNVWYVFPGQKYMVLAKAFAEGFDAREISITKENELKMESSTVEFWNLSQVSNDSIGSYEVLTSRLLSPVSQGKGNLVASLTYRTEASGPAKVLNLLQEVNVCSKVKAFWDEGLENSNVIHLPWVPGVYQKVELKAIGGCGKTRDDYKLFSSDERVASVSDSCIVRAEKPGQAVIRVVSVFDFLNFDEIIVEVSTPSMLSILPVFPVEVPVGTRLHTAVALKTFNGHSFSRCDHFNAFIRWSLLSENESFQILNTTEASSIKDLKHNSRSWGQNGNPCAWISLNASAAGRATIVATFSFDSDSDFETFTGPIFLKATSKISAYYPLVVLQGGNGNQFGGYWFDLSGIHSRIQNMVSNSPKELYLVPGSTMNVFLFGGPERWDQVVDFVETVDAIGESKNQIISSAAVQKLSSGLYQVSCQSKVSYKLLFSRGNMIGKDHPVPAIAKSEFAVVCDFPSAITVIANENENRIDILEAASKGDRGPDRLQTSPVVISNGRSIRLAAVGIHENGRFFANSSSLCLKWEVTGCEGLAYFDEVNAAEMLDESAWERFLVLQNSTGLCTVRATVIGFSTRFAGRTHEEEYTFFQTAHDSLTDAIQLQIVSSLRVTPEYVLLVFHPEAQESLTVSGGTCSLDASTNDTHVVQVVRHPGKALCSQLILGARGSGSAIVTIQDIGLSPRATIHSLVRVANVDWIQIIAEDHMSLMEGSTQDFQILAGTQDGQVFGDSQYKYMGIELHLGDEILDLISPHELMDEPKFSIKAAKAGITSLYVSTKQHSGQRVLSQVVRVEVYKPLQIHPEYIYLTPGASFVLSVKGGPKVGVSIEYSSLDMEIVEVQNATGKLSAKAVGNSTVRAAVLTNGGTFVCEAFGRVEVDIPVAMILNTQSDRLCVGCSMPIYPSLPEGDLFSFYETCQSYSWMIADEKVVTFQSAKSWQYRLDQGLYLEGKDYPWFSNGSGNAFINHVIGRSAGKTKISISVTCDFLLPGTSGSVVSYNVSKTILVVPDPPLALGLPITWLFPPFYTTAGLLPRSVNSFGEPDSHDLESSVGYSLLRGSGRSGSVIQDSSIIDGSKIRTGESNAVDCIQAKDHSTGRTEIAACLRVAEVTQVRVAAAESSIQIVYLSVNDRIELDIKYADELGYIFSEAHGVAPVKVETNYPDVVSILTPKDGNGTYGTHERFVLQASGHGTALIRLHVNHIPKKADFIMVSVGAQMYPRDVVLHSGQHLNFTIIGDRMDIRGSGHWLSTNEDVVHVNRITGEAQARGEGVAEVIFKGSNLKLQTTITVLKVNQIVVDAPAETLTNAAGPPDGYKFSVGFSDSTGHSTGSSVSQINVPFDCQVEPSFVGFVEPWCDHAAKKSYCLFHPYSPAQLWPVKLNPMEGFLHILVRANLKEDPKVTGSAHALLVKGFYVKEPGKLSLTPSSNHSVITIGGNSDVELFWSAKDLLSVSRVDTNENKGLPSQIVYRVEALKRQPFSDKVTIVLPATGQTEEVEISYDTGGETEPSSSGLTTLAVILTCVVVPIATVALFMKSLEKPTRQAASRHTAPTTPAAAGSPAMTDPASPANGQLSPRTPQPFMEYVRRTIDDTPYYKRDARRRFNPQNTY